jgi:hypothetical protein
MSLTVEWIRSVAQIETLADQWTALETVVQDRTPLSTFDYLVTWYSNYAGAYGGDPLIGLARRGTRLVGVAPLVVRRGRVGRIPVTRVDFAAHDAHAGEFLVEDDHPDTVAVLLDSLARVEKFDVICLNGLARGSDRFRALQDVAARHQLKIELTDHPYAVADLRAGYDAYCGAMSRNFRRTLKRQAQRITSAGRPAVGGVQLAAGIEGIEDGIVRLVAITEASYKLQGRPLAHHHRGLLTGLARRFGPRGMLNLSILSIDGRDAAFIMGLVERGCFYDVTLAYDEAFRDLSPGAYLMQEMVRNLAGAGVHTVISRGAHHYKKRWATAFLPSTRMFLFSSGVRGSASRFIRFSLDPVWRRLGWPAP